MKKLNCVMFGIGGTNVDTKLRPQIFHNALKLSGPEIQSNLVTSTNDPTKLKILKKI